MSHDYTPVRTLIVDGNENDRIRISELLEDYRVFEIVGQEEFGKQAITRINESEPDLIFMEVVLQDMTGFEVLNKIRLRNKPLVVFITYNQNYAITAFEYFAFDYILKPFTDERFRLTMMKIREYLGQKSNDKLQDKLNALFRYIRIKEEPNGAIEQTYTEILPVKLSGRIYFVPVREIEYIIASGYYIEIFAHGKKHLLRDSLSNMIEKLDQSRFIRIHRSVIINLDFLKEINKLGANDFSVKMTSDETFKISKSYKQVVFEKVGL